MSRHIPGLILSYTAGAAVTKHRIVKFDGSDDQVEHAVAATDLSIGVTERFDAGADERVDVVRTGLARVEYGGAVTRGAALTAGANGRAVVTTTQGRRIIGIAEVSGVAGDLGAVLLVPQLA